MKSNSTIAKRLATQMWGRPDHQHKLADGIWEFSTPRHGGIIVDIEVRPLLREYLTEVTLYRKYAMDYEQHFAAFEEDCDAAIVEWVYGNEFHNKRFRSRYRSDPELSDKVFFEERLRLIKESLKRWHPEVLEKWPEPYVDKGKKHAAWLDRSTCENLHWVYWTECSACGNPLDKDLVSNPPSECPHCGAIMLEKEPKR